ncbi:MAG: RNA 2',3'-cyclic phosphodiesterase [bacterium]
MDRIRAFVALPLPETARARLAALRHAADPGAPVRWVAPDAIHLTLKFLGEIEPARVEAVKEALARHVGERGAFDFTLAGVGGFPALARPRVLWAGVSDGAPAVVALAERVEGALEPLGFPREARRFTPHVTIGRVKDSPARAPRNWGERFGAAASLEPLAVRAETLVLFESRLSSSGARYSPLLQIAL